VTWTTELDGVSLAGIPGENDLKMRRASSLPCSLGGQGLIYSLGLY
jgi:hypothetical protein